uniref:Uncharacterized protein n=1 Tax=Tetranychus urticae TaxID=32264 RepID=T1JZW5_TETUR
MLSALKVEDGRTQRYFGNKVLLVGLEDGNILLQDSCTRQADGELPVFRAVRLQIVI